MAVQPTKPLADPDNPVVVDALTRTCGMCKKPPGEHCVNIVDGQPLNYGAIVHNYRVKPRAVSP